MMNQLDNTAKPAAYDNIYKLINDAAKRAYQLRRGAQPLVEPTSNHVSTALKEILENKVKPEDL
jgi:DNA-directed RNA polymerase omega subunit